MMPTAPEPERNFGRQTDQNLNDDSFLNTEDTGPLLDCRDGKSCICHEAANTPYNHNEQNSPRRILRMPFRCILDMALLLLISFLFLERSHYKLSMRHESELAEDITGFAPRVSRQVKSFSRDTLFVPENASDFFSPTVRNTWLSIVPKGLGYVNISQPEEYDNLPTPLKGYPRATFTTSVTHQLHCIHMLAQTIAAFVSGKLESLPATGIVHSTHCIDYIRQGIMCCGDTALEGQQTTFPEGFKGSDGWDAKHVCKDYEQVMLHLEQESINSEKWI